MLHNDFNDKAKMGITQAIQKITEALPPHVTLVAVSKTKPISDIEEAYHAGQRVFGENKIQEMVTKWEALPKDIEWHMIGHVQRNKVKYMAPFVHLIHAIDSIKLLQEVNKQAEKNNRSINCLLQIKIAKEDTKFGMSSDEAAHLLQVLNETPLPHVNVVGLMGMGTFTSDASQINEEFQFLKTTFETLRISFPSLQILSMGMSSDYEIAIENGSNMVRIGSTIFGTRNYN